MFPIRDASEVPGRCFRRIFLVSASGDSGAASSDGVVAAVGTTPDCKPAQVLPILEKNGPTQPRIVVHWDLTAEEKQKLRDLLMKLLSELFRNHFKVGKEDFDFLCWLHDSSSAIG